MPAKRGVADDECTKLEQGPIKTTVAGPESSRSGQVFFERVGVLHTRKFDRESSVEIAHDAALNLSERDQSSHCRERIAGDRSARQGQVDDPASQARPIRQGHRGTRIFRLEAFMTAILGRTQKVPVGEPGQLRGELLPLAGSGRDGHRKAIGVNADDRSFETAEMIDVGNDAFALSPGHRRDNRHSSRRHVDDLTGKLAPISQHISAKEIDAHTLKASPFVVLWQDVENLIQHGCVALLPSPGGDYAVRG